MLEGVIVIKIEKLQINNFRSFKNIGNEISDLEQLNIFTGKNNVGKTNVLRALNLFFNPELYNSSIDMNAIKQITGGGTKDPVIKIYFIYDELERGKSNKYYIKLDLNKKKYISSSKNSKLADSNKIRDYLQSKFKCIYLSTTDQDLSSQAYNLINDMILQYFKKKHKVIRNTIDDFEKQYRNLLSTFKDQISSIESDLNEQFELFRENGIGITPKLSIQENTKITDFLLSNMNLQLDDDYAQIINAKGAGVQRTSVILLTFFLLNEIFQNKNKVVLLDEPEAFLYPLLTSGLKESIKKMVSQENSNSQIFVTTHSREFLKEINNRYFRFYNITQKKEIQEFKRSKNDEDIVKYSIVNGYEVDVSIKNQVLKNYGLLDEIDDYDQIIICEGETDKNYIEKILNSKPYRPQIRYNKYLNDMKDLNFDFIGKGTESILPILLYLDRVSNVSRDIFILLDGDEAGKTAEKKIKQNTNGNNFSNFNITICRLQDGKEIEDVVYEEEDFIQRLYSISNEICEKKQEFREYFDRNKENKNYIDILKEFINYHGLNIHEGKIKSLLSQNLNSVNIQSEWLLEKIDPIFYKD
ncbi:ATP-dependent nuclease [Streptococcus sp.]